MGVIRKSRREGKKNPSKRRIAPTYKAEQPTTKTPGRCNPSQPGHGSASHSSLPSAAALGRSARPAKPGLVRETHVADADVGRLQGEGSAAGKAKQRARQAPRARPERAGPCHLLGQRGSARGEGVGGQPDGDRSLGTQKSGTATRAREKRKRENKSRGSAPRASPDFHLLVNEPALPRGTRQPRAPPSLAPLVIALGKEPAPGWLRAEPLETGSGLDLKIASSGAFASAPIYHRQHPTVSIAETDALLPLWTSLFHLHWTSLYPCLLNQKPFDAFLLPVSPHASYANAAPQTSSSTS